VDIDMPPKQPKKVQNQKAMPHDRSSMEHKEKKGMTFASCRRFLAALDSALILKSKGPEARHLICTQSST